MCVHSQASARWLESLSPYLLLLGTVFIAQFYIGILQALWLNGALLRINNVMRRQVALKRDVQLPEVGSALFYIISNAGIVLWLFTDAGVFRSFLLLPPSPSYSSSGLGTADLGVGAAGSPSSPHSVHLPFWECLFR